MDWLSLITDPHRLLMFSAPVYKAVLAQHNRDALLVVALASTAGAALVVALAIGRRLPAAPVYLALAALWAWLGAVFHLVYFAPVNAAATWLGAGSLLQAAMFLYFALFRARGRRIGPPPRRLPGLAWLGVALLLGPATAMTGAPWDSVGYFATAPHTLVFATGACLLLTDRPPWALCLPAGLLAIVDAATAFLLGEWFLVSMWLFFLATLVASTRAGRGAAGFAGDA